MNAFTYGALIVLAGVGAIVGFALDREATNEYIASQQPPQADPVPHLRWSQFCYTRGGKDVVLDIDGGKYRNLAYYCQNGEHTHLGDLHVE